MYGSACYSCYRPRRSPFGINASLTRLSSVYVWTSSSSLWRNKVWPKLFGASQGLWIIFSHIISLRIRYRATRLRGLRWWKVRRLVNVPWYTSWHLLSMLADLPAWYMRRYALLSVSNEGVMDLLIVLKIYQLIYWSMLLTAFMIMFRSRRFWRRRVHLSVRTTVIWLWQLLRHVFQRQFLHSVTGLPTSYGA